MMDLSLNVRNDTHVSFCAMFLAVAPAGRQLMVCTDASQLLFFDLPKWQRGRCIYGVDSDMWHLPRAVWHPNAQHVYCAAPSGKLCIYDVTSGKVDGCAEGHSGRVRQLLLCVLEGKLCLLSCSFDRSVLLFGAP
jgi:hypothetical protein